jgi:signal transduction histidine kinase
LRTLVQILDYINLAAFTLAAVLALAHWRAGHGGRASLWAAGTFVSLAIVVDVGLLLPDEPSNTLELVANRTLIALLVLFPYLLYQFASAFEPRSRGLERFLVVMTAGLVIWTYALPDVPQEGEPRPSWFTAYLLAFLLHWTILAALVSIRFLRAGRRQPTVTRRRIELLGVAAAAITVALVLAVAGPEEGSAGALIVALLALVSAIAFVLGLAPPRILRMVWRRPEAERLQDAITRLMSATTEEEVAREVLPPMARIVGARAAALRSRDGRVIGAHGASDELLAASDGAPEDGRSLDGEIIEVDVPEGSLLVWTSPYAPYFGADELELLRTLGVLTGLALDRSRLFAQEREARRVLERADELKTNFVALAAHELRTPVATIDGIIQTLDRHANLPGDQRELLKRTLTQQGTHLRTLVDQLLDLSRLDADAVRIEPKPIQLREHVEHVVRAAAGERAHEVGIEVEPETRAVADPTALERVIANLVINALRHGAPPYTVRAEQRDRHLRVAVEDRGPGVPAELVPDLFERFTRGRATRQRVPGTGLGLAIARSYATAHGGDLIYSDAEPTGARFELVLPNHARAKAH